MNKKTDWVGIQRDTTSRVHAQALSELKKRNEALTEALENASKERDTALALSKQKLVSRKIVAEDDGESEATAFAMFSDWHAEETVLAKTVNGLNEYNLEVADRRITKLCTSVVRLTEIQRAGTRIDNLVVNLMGDMMTGYIHEELQEMNGLSPTETVLWLRQRIVGGLRYIQKNGGFKKITVTCNYGNHGRTTKKPRHATGASNSYEWMLYHILKDDMPELEWVIADGYFVFIDVYGRVFRIHHGDNVQYQGGIGGLTIPMEKAVASWNKSQPVYHDLVAHHHTAMQNPRWISNGSLIGYGPYSLAIKAGFEPPQQTYFLVDSKRGRTGTFPIFLE